MSFLGMELIRLFGHISKNDAPIAGGKGASLGEMTRAGIPVPPGFVILSSSFERFLEETDLNVEIDAILDKVNHKEIHTVEHASEQIRGLILNAMMPQDIAQEIRTSFKNLGTPYVAVRSSATAEDSASAAWAGQLDSFLNTTETTLLENVKRCWASLFTPRAIFYRFEKGLHETKISVAVVVQKMVSSEVSGIAFSVHPVTEDRNQLIIEAGFGLGEAIVSGTITPDSYVVEKEPRRIIDTTVNTQTRALYRNEAGGNVWRDIPEPKASSQVLTVSRIQELSDIILTIENHYGFPCDIEWAYEGGEFYVVQSRPITTLSAKGTGQNIQDALLSEASSLNPDDYVFSGFYNSPPFNAWSWTNWYYPELAQELGFHIDFPGYVCIGKGHVFAEKHTFQIFENFVRSKFENGEERIFSDITRRIDKEARDAFTWADGLDPQEDSSAQSMEELMLHLRRINFYWAMGYCLGVSSENILGEQAKKHGVDVSDITNYVGQPTTPLMERQEEIHVLRGMLEKEKALQGKLQDVDRVVAFVEGHPKILREFQKHLQKYPWVGFMGFLGQPLSLQTLIEQVVVAESENQKRKSIVPKNKEFKRYIDAAIAFLYVNQVGAEYFPMLAEKTKFILNRIAEKIDVSHDDVLLLMPDEFFSGTNLRSDLKEKIRQRKERNVIMFHARDGRGHIIDDGRVVDQITDRFMPKKSRSDSEVLLRGQIGNKGVALGRVRIVLSTHEKDKMNKGDVLVTSMTTPDFVPLMQKASAIVTDMGGLLSHAVIMSRELNKPCVIGTKIAAQVLHDGDLVEVDAERGIVTILERAGDRDNETKNKIPDFIHHVAFLASRPQSVQRDEAAYMFLKRWEHLGVGVVSIPLEGNNRALYMEKSSMQKIYGELINALGTEQRWEEHLKEYERLMTEYEKAARIFRTVDSEKERLKNAFDIFFELCVRLSDYVWIPFTIDTDFGASFRERLKEQSGDRYESIQEGIASPTRFHEYQNMRLAICEHVINGDDMRQAAADLTEKYAWYGEYSYVEKLYDEEYFQAELAKLTPKGAADEKKKLNDDLRENIRRFENALSKISDPTTALHAKIVNQYLFLRTDRVDSFKKLQAAFRNVFEKIAENLRKETGETWSMKEMVSMTNGEILEYLDGVSVPDKKEIARRVRRYVYYRNPQITRVLTDEKEMGGIIDVVLSSVGQDEGIKGLVAYKGVVTGRVATVFGKDDLRKVTDGSVLVARTTMVDYISAMERAVAFVTEEGGVTSHAAIVARELKKPCIVGTGNCTKILKDGDLVEVDADNGMVRILEGEKEDRSVLDGLSSQIFFPEGGRACYFYAHYSIVHMYSISDAIWPLDVSAVGDFGNHLVKWYIAVKSEKEFDKYLDRFLGDPLVLDTLENFITETREAAVEKLKVDYLELADDELVMIAKEYYFFYETILRAAGTLRCVDRAIVPRLRDVFGSSTDPDELIRLASTSEKLSFSLKEERELLQLAIWLKKEKVAPASGEAVERIKRIHDDYCWLVRGYYNEKEKTVSDYRAILDEMIEKQPEITLADLNVKITRELEEKQRVFAAQNRSDDTLIRIASEAAYLKDYFKFSINKMAYFAEPLFAEIARRAGRTPDFIKDLYPQETIALLHGETIDISAVEERLRHSILISNKGRCCEYVGAEANQFEARYLAKDQNSKNEFKGRIASAGYGCGRAKVVLSGADFHKLEEGDVLVVMNTSPDFVPILGRAAAIVAEEGGIAAHVSVISRELNIPCVVGIPYITQMIKDGDCVEVDADNGMVRIIGI